MKNSTTERQCDFCGRRLFLSEDVLCRPCSKREVTR